LITENLEVSLAVSGGEVLSDPGRDILKISVIERHLESGYFASGFVRGFKLRCGAIASTIAHDCHNIIVVGVDAHAMAEATKYLKEIDGGIVVWKNAQEKKHLALPLAGLISFESPERIAELLESLINLTKSMGCDLEQPFIHLSFLALPVIGALKITDRGLVDVERGEVIPVVS
jgi:adenine deaminase